MSACALLAGCASLWPDGFTPDSADMEAAIQSSAWAAQSQIALADENAAWRHKTFGDRRPTRYRPERHAGRPAVHADSLAGNSSLRLEMSTHPGAQAGQLRFSWFVPALIDEADLMDREVDDAVARVILLFDGDRLQAFTPRDHVISELARLVTGEPLPYATLIYVWDNRYPVGSVIANPHTNRIRQLVVESGPDRLGQWIDVERDVQADYRQVFGETAGPLLSIGIMTDSNNTGAAAQAWFGPLSLTSARGSLKADVGARPD
ncbi:MAG TPA: DUF3047 domain-containing protein [Hydrogenophaga sp.]|uniref:DUF3047 domain-containing protein n=1 Tax=Hydrogenophaga sp. TaxID=1904254 RepID=UPI002CF86623|nr:DUF3047 domain-containing protein [Hydrogenophaga sp.]HMN93849.1 DUF3047 domain-containing protein [Hydrogenophaga sp.]HMP09864.1 DUF3047 domain-containing protein [Hydrogenophaga sp.]